RRYNHSLTLLVILFNATATPAIYTLSLHDALPILAAVDHHQAGRVAEELLGEEAGRHPMLFLRLCVEPQLNPPLVSATEEHWVRSEEHTSELQSRGHLVCRLLLEKKNTAQVRIEQP